MKKVIIFVQVWEKKTQIYLAGRKKHRNFAADLCRSGSDKQAHDVLRQPVEP